MDKHLYHISMVTSIFLNSKSRRIEAIVLNLRGKYKVMWSSHVPRNVPLPSSSSGMMVLFLSLYLPLAAI